jgi:hypothetical protein
MGGLTLLDPFGADLAGEDRGSCRGRVTARLRRLDGNGGDGGEWRGAAASGTGTQANDTWKGTTATEASRGDRRRTAATDARRDGSWAAAGWRPVKP